MSIEGYYSTLVNLDENKRPSPTSRPVIKDTDSRSDELIDGFSKSLIRFQHTIAHSLKNSLLFPRCAKIILFTRELHIIVIDVI